MVRHARAVLAAGMAAVVVMLAGPAAALAEDPPMEATTAKGEKVRLFPNGRWEFVNEQKAAVQRQAVAAEQAHEQSAQGGLFGSRRIYEGDKDYNRGTLNPKMR